MINIKFLLAIIMVVLSVTAFSQDTTRKKTIDITSTFKPVLKEAAKINFNAAPPAADGRKPVLQYNVPSQNLLLGYQPVPIQPVALQVDSAAAWKNSNYIKVGLGNVTIPYVQAGLSFGDSKTKFYNIFANHYSSKGSLPFQKNNRTEVTAAATYKTPGNLEWNGKLGFTSQQYFLYGYRPETLVFTKDQLRQRFQTFGGKLSLRNMEPTEYGINYNPGIKISVFSGSNDIDKATEANAVLNVPVQKTINENFAVNLGITADLTNFRPRDTATIQNNLYYVSPAVVYTKDNLSITAGIIPSWENKKFSMLPNIMADIYTEHNFTLQFGWIGYFNKGSYERFASVNPWLSQPKSLLNTRVHEVYGGLKGTLAGHFTYSAKLGYVSYRNMPLFINDSIDGKTFNILYASSMQNVQVHGEIGYIQGENFNASAFVTINNYRIKEQPKAYGLQPIELGATLRWQAVKNLWFNSDLNVFSGAPYYITSSKSTRSGKSGIDLSAGVEYKITRQLNLWFQMNNIFNNKYERWNQYNVYGFNVLGGIIFSFDQK